MRKRAANEQHVADLLDQDEQEELVQSLEQEAQEHAQHVRHLFSVVCWGAMGLAVLVAVFPVLFLGADNWTAVVMHACVSVSLHWLAMKSAVISETELSIQRSDMVLLGLSLLPLLVVVAFLRTMDHVEVHLGLTLSNVLTMAFSYLVRSDASSTHDAVQGLRLSKYKYKSI
jgi:VIT1/CCC1 family predicted Fe2+/Mn2+ transporter